MKWLNFGGGHHITRPDYDRELLKRCIRHVQETYGVDVYLEPGEAVALNAGILLTEVLEIVDNGMQIAVLDASAACHMPDVLEMPYRPPLRDAGDPSAPDADRPYIYRLAGTHVSCGRCNRGLYFFRSAETRGAAGVSGHGDLYNGKEQYIQRNEAAGHSSRERGRNICDRAHVRVRGLQIKAVGKACV